MLRRAVFRASFAFPLVLAIAGCGEESKTATAEVDLCADVVKLALAEPQDFTVTGNRIDETSEGEFIILEVDYTGSSGTTVHATEKCWFAGYGDKRTLKSLYIDVDGELVQVPDGDLAGYLAEATQG